LLSTSRNIADILTWLGFSFGLCLAQEPVTAPQPQAPPTPPPIITRKVMQGMGGIIALGGPTLYSIGTPTDEEQYYVELINRARANPPTEGLRLATTTDPDVVAAIASFSVDLAMLQAEFNAISPAPPVSISAALTASARGHSDWMFANAVQSHTGAGGSDPGARITSAGYTWTTYGENIFSYAKSVFYGHAGFQIDWGSGTGGMQGPPRGHRSNIHSNGFREIGVGVRLGSNTVNSNTVGPQLVTQDFGTVSGATPFVTGVVYYDLNGNGFYDPGEGVGGVTVSVQGSTYYAVSANSGGYSVPVPNSDATRTVSFSGPGLGQSLNATISGLNNAKADFVPPYSTPAVSGPATAYTGSSSNYTINAVGGATQYGWQYAEKLAASAENCDTLANFTTATTAGYNVVETGVKDSGTASLHMAHPAVETQTITFSKTYYPQAGSTLQFKSRLGYAGTAQTAHVQVAVEGTSNWTDVYTQGGTGGSGEAGFVARTASLASYAGQFIRIRFAYSVVSGSYFPQTSSGVGWYLDTISFTNTSELSGATAVDPLASPAFSFSPPKTGTFLLSARPYISGRYWSFGPVKEVTAQAPTGYAGWVATTYPQVTEGPAGDHDGDGLANVVEYAFELDPTIPTSSALLPQPSVQGSQLQVSYTASATGITYGGEWSNDLQTWTPLTDTGSGTTHTFGVSTSGQSKIFFRHRITILP